ncbi:MAG: M23 family peptidase [Pseudolabrys sp.]|nr:M23 family peptidase [Pseudolabrys sp.]
MKRAVLVSLALQSFALLVAGPVAAGEMVSPAITLSDVNWAAAAAALPDAGTAPPAEAFARLNAIAEKRFAGIAKSTVPVLLPFDIDAFRKDVEAGKPEAASSEKYFGGFHPTKFFLAGPAGYDATFTLSNKADGLKLRFDKPIMFEISGATYIYGLEPSNHVEKEAIPKGLDEQFPGIRRILSEAHVRYVFERFGVPYVLSIQCYDMRPSSKHLTCREADPLALRFLNVLRIAGGAPAKIPQPKFDLSRPAAPSDFTYYSPGDLIENSGWKKMPGRVDYNVYSRMRFPIANAPGYVISQSFMPWGDCYRTGTVGRMGKKGAKYHCKVNNKPLVFDESTAENFSYPWRDNFCELRDFLVGQCPGGYGHQGQDIRPSNCVLFNAGSDRCLPYHHTVAAVHDGIIRRLPGNIGVYIVVNTENERVRFRYLHMNPNIMDAEGLLNGRQVSEGEILGKVATWGDYENGTSYHINFNIQVFTKIGWVWVNPYMSLVAAYERLIGGRGTEILPGQPAPPIPDKPPVILNPAVGPAAASLAPTAVLEGSAVREKPQQRRPRVRHKSKPKAKD